MPDNKNTIDPQSIVSIAAMMGGGPQSAGLISGYTQRAQQARQQELQERISQRETLMQVYQSILDNPNTPEPIKSIIAPAMVAVSQTPLEKNLPKQLTDLNQIIQSGGGNIEYTPEQRIQQQLQQQQTLAQGMAPVYDEISAARGENVRQQIQRARTAGEDFAVIPSGQGGVDIVDAFPQLQFAPGGANIFRGQEYLGTTPSTPEPPKEVKIKMRGATGLISGFMHSDGSFTTLDQRPIDPARIEQIDPAREGGGPSLRMVENPLTGERQFMFSMTGDVGLPTDGTGVAPADSLFPSDEEAVHNLHRSVSRGEMRLTDLNNAQLNAVLKYDSQQPEGKSLFLDRSDREGIRAIDESRSILDRMEKHLNTILEEGPFSEKGRAAGVNLRRLKQTVGARFARAMGEVGNMTDEDIKRSVSLLPDYSISGGLTELAVPGRAQSGLDEFRNILDAQEQAIYDSYRRVGESEGLTPPPVGTGTQGNTVTAPDGTRWRIREDGNYERIQ